MKKSIIILIIFLITGCSQSLGDVPPIPDIALSKMQGKYAQATKIKTEYKMEKASFIKEAKDQNAIQTEVGDKSKEEFEPSLTLRKWDDEVSFKIKANLQGVAKKDRTLHLEDKKIKLKTPKKEYHFYSVPATEDMPESYEFEIILLEKPDSNVISLDVELKGMECYYQPELTQEEIDEGSFRPENVIGSYACYHSTKAGNYEAMGGKNYMAGKAFHIYRPQMEDSNGVKTWGILEIKGNKLTVEIPQAFLDTASYPVRHASGLTFGKIAVGGTSGVLTGGSLRAFIFAGAAGTGVSMSGYFGANSESQHAAKMGLYKTSDSSFIMGTSEVNTQGDVWRTSNFTSQPTVEAINYYLTFHINGNAELFWDDTNVDYYYQYTSYAGGFPNPASFTQSSGDRELSIYVTYTTGGDPTPDPPHKAEVMFFN